MTEKTIELSKEAYRALKTYREPHQTPSEAVLELVERVDDDTLTHGGGIDRAALSEDQRAVVEVINEQFAATKKEDVAGYLGTMHPEARTEALEQEFRQLWSQYDLSVECTVQTVTVEGDEAAADIRQTTEKIAGPEFADNTILERFHLARENGQWYVTRTDRLETEPHLG